MRRIIGIAALAFLVLAAASLAIVATTAARVVPLSSPDATVVTRHVDGTVKVREPARDGHGARTWLARFEVRTTSGDVRFGYLHLFGVDGDVAGQVHESGVDHVDYGPTSGGQQATLRMEECPIIPSRPCFPTEYRVVDGSPDAFLADLGWTILSGDISIYSTTGQDSR